MEQRNGRQSAKLDGTRQARVYAGVCRRLVASIWPGSDAEAQVMDFVLDLDLEDAR